MITAEIRALAAVIHEAQQRRQTAAGVAVAVADAVVGPLRARVAELEAERHSTNEALSDAAEALREKDTRIAERTVWRAEHHESGMVLGHYATRQAAMACIHATLAAVENTTAAAIELRVIWRADDPDGPEDADTPWECWLLDTDGADDAPTSYMVAPIEIESAYDPAGDQ